MNLSESFATAIDSLLANKMRAALTMLGVIIGVGAVIALMGLGNGFNVYINDQIRSLGTNLVYVVTDGDASEGYPTLTMQDAKALQDKTQAPDVAVVAPFVQETTDVVYLKQKASLPVLGVTPEYFAVNNVKELTAGNFFDQEDVDGRLRVAILGARAAEELFIDGTYPLGESIKIGGASYRVIAVAQEIGGADTSVDNNIYIPLTVAQAYLPPSRTKRGLDAFSAISIMTTSEESTDAAVDQITRVLRAQHGIAYAGEDDFRIVTQKDLLETFNTITAGFTVFLGSIAGISLLVGGIGIMNIMLVSVTERTREIGIRKAIGALQRDILIQFMIEALVLSLLGGLIGVGLGMLAAFGIGPLFDVTAIVDLPTITLATSFAAAVGLVFGIYPAWRAARLRPIEALRYE